MQIVSDLQIINYRLTAFISNRQNVKKGIIKHA